MAVHDNKNVRFGHHKETIHPLPKGGSARIRPRKATSPRSTTSHERTEPDQTPRHPSFHPTNSRSKATKIRPSNSSSGSMKPLSSSKVSAPERKKATHHKHSTTPLNPTSQGAEKSRTASAMPHRDIPRQTTPKATTKNHQKKSNIKRKKKASIPIFPTNRSKFHRLKPLLFRYIIPLSVISLLLSLVTLIGVPGRVVAPVYSMEDFRNHTPYHYKGSYNRDFNDLNDIQLTAAAKLGISPAETREEAAQSKRLVPIKCRDVITIDPLTHSQALLVPRAHDLLEQIGSTFMGRLAEDKLPLYRLILTSGTRTREDVHTLRRRNGNASENSTHMYGTTFDISWKRFDKVDPNDPRSLDPGELKHLLAIVLKDFHDRGYCYIKHERRQACFHITTRP